MYFGEHRYSDNRTCCHPETDASHQTCRITQSKHPDTVRDQPVLSADPISSGAWQGSHWNINLLRDRITNEEVRNRVRAATGPHDDFLSIVKTRKQIVLTRYTISRTCKDHRAGHSTRLEETRQTKETLRR